MQARLLAQTHFIARMQIKVVRIMLIAKLRNYFRDVSI